MSKSAADMFVDWFEGRECSTELFVPFVPHRMIVDILNPQHMFSGSATIKFNDVILLTEDERYSGVLKEVAKRITRAGHRAFFVSPTRMLDLRPNISGGLLHVRNIVSFRKSLRGYARYFPKPHPTNQDITRLRITNAIRHRGQYTHAVTGENFPDQFFLNAEDATAAYLGNSTPNLILVEL